MRSQPAAKARRPGARGALAQPGISAKGTGRILAAGRAGAGHAGQGSQAAQARSPPAGSSAQPARTRIAARQTAKARTMWVIYLEMGVALALLILIVWWTWPAKQRGRDSKDDGAQ
jgi:hypothetical protein